MAPGIRLASGAFRRGTARVPALRVDVPVTVLVDLPVDETRPYPAG